MPGHDIHSKVVKLLLKEDYSWLDKIIDAPYLVKRSKHRQLFGHNKKYSPLWVYLLRGKTEDVLAWYIHYTLDNNINKSNEDLVRLILSLLK